MNDHLRTVISTIEKLTNEQQEQAAQELEAWLAEQHFDAFIASDQGQAFLDELRAEADQAERDGTIKDSPDEDWA
jgi:CHASE3 domain sensor protein